MKVILTENAEDNLWAIYRYHTEYSEDYAEQFQDKFDDFVFTSLSRHPKMGTLYNPVKEVYRMVYEGRYNIYYVIRDNGLYIVYVLDGRLQLNLKLAEPDAELPPLNQ